LPDGAAFDAFFRENFARIVRASARVTLDVSVAGDIAAEAFARLWGKWSQIDDDDHAGGFVFKTAMRLCYRELSRRRRKFRRAPSPADPDAESRLDGVRRSGSTRREMKWTATVACLALFLGGLGWAALELSGRPLGPCVARRLCWAEYHQRDQNWTLRYPLQWHLQPFGLGCISAGAEGVLVSNIDHDFKQVRGSNFCTHSWDMRGLPPTLVVIQMGVSGGGPLGCGPINKPDTPLPLSLDNAERAWDGQEYLTGNPQPRLYLPVIVDGNDYVVDAWLGQEASPLDIQIARRIVGSIEFGHQTKPCQ
jgi:hypothetical protein